jgi:hypothetical protein
MVAMRNASSRRSGTVAKALAFGAVALLAARSATSAFAGVSKQNGRVTPGNINELPGRTRHNKRIDHRLIDHGFIPNVEDKIDSHGNVCNQEKGDCMWKTGDRVRLKWPILRSNQGHGYFNEGGGADLKNPDGSQRRSNKEIQEDVEVEKFIEGGTEGTVVMVRNEGVMPYIYDKPIEWRGKARPYVIVDFEDPDIPMEAVEEWDLELVSNEMSKLWAEAKKQWNDDRDNLRLPDQAEERERLGLGPL